MPDALDAHDDRRRRCPMLGHDVPFSYCRAPAADMPCRRILDCWWQSFDVDGYLHSHWSEQEIRQILAPRPDKRVTLLELIEQARRSQKPR